MHVLAVTATRSVYFLPSINVKQKICMKKKSSYPNLLNPRKPEGTNVSRSQPQMFTYRNMYLKEFLKIFIQNLTKLHVSCPKPKGIFCSLCRENKYILRTFLSNNHGKSCNQKFHHCFILNN